MQKVLSQNSLTLTKFITTSSFTRTYVARRLVSARLVVIASLIAHSTHIRLIEKNSLLPTYTRTEGRMEGHTLLKRCVLTVTAKIK